MARCVLLAVLALALVAPPASALRASPHLDALEAALLERVATLGGAADRAARRQLRTAEKALARLAADTGSSAEDLRLAKKIAGRVAKAFADDAEVMGALAGAADGFERELEDHADVLGRARAGLPDAKLTRKADRLLAKSERMLEKARSRTEPARRVKLLYEARRRADKAAAVLARALGAPVPTRLVLLPRSALLTEPGETLALEALVLDQLERPMAEPVSFVSTDPAVASVDPAGVVTAGAVGSAQVVATAGALETAALVVSARPAPGAVLVGDESVVSLPEPVDEDALYGVGFRYTVSLFGPPPAIGSLLVGTGEVPLGGLVVDVAGADPALVTLEIRPLEELFAELVVDEQIESGPENLWVPEDVLADYVVEPGEDGAYVFVPREGAPAAAARGVQGTVAESVGPFLCESDVAFPLGLNSPPTFTIAPSLSVDFQYSTAEGLQRLVATGGATLTASYKPRIQAAVQGKVACKARLFGMTLSVPGPIAFLVGGYVPIGIGFEAQGTVTVAQLGFDATFEDSFAVQVGVDCTGGPCEPVAGAPDPAPPTGAPTPPFQWVVPNVLEDFNVGLDVNAFGYFELRIGNPLWETLQLKMVEGQAGVAQSANLAPRLTQAENAGSASSYKLTLYAKVGSGASLRDVLELFSLNLASFEVKAELDVAASPSASSAPDGSLAFAGPVAAGDTVEATVILKDVTYLGLDNVEEVRFYRKQGPVLTLRDSVAGEAGAALPGPEGLVEYVGTWTAEAADLGAEFAVFVTTFVPIVEFEIEANSLRTLEAGSAWSAEVTFPDAVEEETDEPLVVVVTDEDGEPVAGATVELEASGGDVAATSGTTDANGRFETSARLSAGALELEIDVTVRDAPGGEVRATATVVATSATGGWRVVERASQVRAGIGALTTDTDQAGEGEGITEALLDVESGDDRAFARSRTNVVEGPAGLLLSASLSGFVQGAGQVGEVTARVVFEVVGAPVPYRFSGQTFGEGAGSVSITLDGTPAPQGGVEGFLDPGVHTLELQMDLESGDLSSSAAVVLGEPFIS